METDERGVGAGGSAPSQGRSERAAAPTERQEWVIPPEMWPRASIKEVLGRDGRTYLLRNDAMFTGIQHSQGEHSDFFLAIRDEKRVFGNRCLSCRHLIVPPFMRRCPSCNFIELTKEYVKDLGILAATPVITIFAPSRFKDQVPFSTGRIFLETEDGALTDTAMLVRARTTRGAVRPGIFHKGTSVKVVFCDHRLGEMLDIFVVPQSELTPEQVATSPLMESDLEWNQLEDATFDEPTPRVLAEFAEIIRGFRTLGNKVAQSKHAVNDLAEWDRLVEIRTEGGRFQLAIRGGKLSVVDNPTGAPDIAMTIKRQEALSGWLQDAIEAAARPQSPSLTDFVLDNVVLLSRNELETITRLDRLPRSLRREGA